MDYEVEQEKKSPPSLQPPIPQQATTPIPLHAATNRRSPRSTPPSHGVIIRRYFAEESHYSTILCRREVSSSVSVIAAANQMAKSKVLSTPCLRYCALSF